MCHTYNPHHYKCSALYTTLLDLCVGNNNPKREAPHENAIDNLLKDRTHAAAQIFTSASLSTHLYMTTYHLEAYVYQSLHTPHRMPTLMHSSHPSTARERESVCVCMKETKLNHSKRGIICGGQIRSANT